MLKRTEKRKRRRKSRNQKVLFLAINSVSIVFLIFVAISSRTGKTYGLFTARAEIDGGSIGICSVYPSQIEELLSQFVQHMNLAGTDYLSIAGYSGSAGEGIADLDLAGATDEQLNQWINEINAKVGNISDRRQSIESLSSGNTSAFESTQSELASAAAVLSQLSGYIGSVSMNCITPSESSLSEFLSSMQAGGAASESLKNQARAIHSALSGSQPELSAVGLSNNDGSTISPAAIGFYQGAQQSLAGANSSLAQQSSTLQQQLAQINDEIASREQAKAVSEDSVNADEPAGDEIDKSEQEEPAQPQEQPQDPSKDQQEDQQQEDQQQEDQPSDQGQDQLALQQPILETN
ncbi:hypothetical protein A8990_10655 [Paenibacillus taihuensis]|uniref:Uncharacterized protein n=1 Tax=Paenibacillus taihuensis TaxID=1156355 RepID=A0A3D9SKM8_9BACL|nr:hypothetical protein [Paenibacillus taihuensis]REE90552.1 hypothetical protein A8990_10655 [Paenibacillus taihuensis]